MVVDEKVSIPYAAAHQYSKEMFAAYFWSVGFLGVKCIVENSLAQTQRDERALRLHMPSPKKIQQL